MTICQTLPVVRERARATVEEVKSAIIALVGIDGAGKTTQARRLAARLTASGCPADYHRNAGGRQALGRIARRLGRRDAAGLLGPDVLLVVEAVLRWLAIARALVLSKLRGRIAVMDRYAVCQYASVRARTGQGSRNERLARVLYSLFPQPDVTYFLTVTPEIAQQRIAARGTDFEDLAFLGAADAAYRGLPEFDAFTVVDASGTPDEVTAQISKRQINERAGVPMLV
jgi:dTMP kinase